MACGVIFLTVEKELESNKNNSNGLQFVIYKSGLRNLKKKLMTIGPGGGTLGIMNPWADNRESSIPQKLGERGCLHQ